MTKIYIIENRLIFERLGQSFCFPYLVSRKGNAFTIKSKDDTTINFSFLYSETIDENDISFADENTLFSLLIKYSDISVSDSVVVQNLENISSSLNTIKNRLKSEKTNHFTNSITNTATKVLNSNSDRKKMIFENTSNQRIFLKFESTATPTNYTISLSQNIPYSDDVFIGEVWAITNAGTSTLQITEFT